MTQNKQRLHRNLYMPNRRSSWINKSQEGKQSRKASTSSDHWPSLCQTTISASGKRSYSRYVVCKKMLPKSLTLHSVLKTLKKLDKTSKQACKKTRRIINQRSNSMLKKHWTHYKRIEKEMKRSKQLRTNHSKSSTRRLSRSQVSTHLKFASKA